MSVAELTSKIERLSVEDYNMVVMLIDRLSSQDDSLRKLSADELVEELTQSMKKSDLGYTKSARSVSSSMRESSIFRRQRYCVSRLYLSKAGN